MRDGSLAPALIRAFYDVLKHVCLAAGLILALIVFSIGIDRIPVTDRDEARFAQASKQMSVSGDWVDIRFQDAPRYKKPVGIYWAQSGVALALGKVGSADIWVYRVPSVIAAALASVLMVWVGTPLVGSWAASVAAIMLGSTFLLHVEARLAKTDAALLLTVITAMGVLARACCAKSLDWRLAGLFWSALAAGILVKGPLILLPVCGAIAWIVALTRETEWLNSLRPMYGSLWMLVLVIPWYLAIILKSDGAFLIEALGRDLAAKLGSAQESHGAPLGSYLLAFWLTAWPWCLLAPAACLTAISMRQDRAVVFLTGWIVPMWLVLELVPTKLLHYPQPVYPAILLLCALALKRPLNLWALHIGTCFFALSLIGFFAIAVLAPVHLGDGLDWLGILGGACAMLCAALGVRSLYRECAERGVLALAVSGVLLSVSVLTSTIPSLSQLFIAERLATATSCHRGPIYIAGFSEPSAVFRLSTEIRFVSEQDAMAALAEEDDAIGWIAVDAPKSTQVVSGLNYSNGRNVILQLFHAPGQPTVEPICQENNNDK